MLTILCLFVHSPILVESVQVGQKHPRDPFDEDAGLPKTPRNRCE